LSYYTNEKNVARAWADDTAVCPSYDFFQSKLTTVNTKAKDSVHKLKAILDNLDAYVALLDTDGAVQEVNRASLDHAGYRREELIGQYFYDISWWNYDAQVRQQLIGAINAAKLAKPSRYDVVVKMGDSLVPIDFRISPVHDEKGQVVNLLFTGVDITERKISEESLLIAAAAFETNEAIMITDVDGNIVRVNRSFEKLTGYSAEEVLGKNPRLLKSERHDKEFYRVMWQTLLSEGVWTGEIWDRGKNGSIYPKQSTITAVKNADGKTIQYVSIFTDISDRKKAEEQVHNLAFYDVLTGLPNRRLLFDRLHLALSFSARSKLFGAVLFLDLDHFKTLNDTMGHDYGDVLLIEVAKRIKFCVREVDTVARLGGDEFIVLMENISSDAETASISVGQVAEKIRAALTTPYLLKGNIYHSSPSIGVSLFFDNIETVEDLIKHADMAMYQAKGSGRNRISFYDSHMQHALESRAALESDLRRAIADEQFRLFYQVQCDNNRRPIGVEALVRWIHPVRGLVSPAQFIPLAEESSLILEIGKWVLESACRQITSWSKNELTKHLVLAVNVSAQEISQTDYVEKLRATIIQYNIDPARLKLELTESIALGDIDTVAAKMFAIKHDLGVAISLDDFGTGYSSLSYLKRLPLDQIKIDQSFVRDITTDPNDAVMVKAIIGMAQNFGLHVIAEGVETEAQLAFLRENGCTSYQGYLFSRPLPVEDFEKFLGPCIVSELIDP
jgi:diguanylate cyclase (GGDEF)-like protein/PAS domain S-box-containing protein